MHGDSHGQLVRGWGFAMYKPSLTPTLLFMILGQGKEGRERGRERERRGEREMMERGWRTLHAPD